MDILKAFADRVEDKLQSTNERLDSNEERFNSFTEDYANNREQDMLAFADQSERADFTSNQNKNNYVLVTGTNYEI